MSGVQEFDFSVDLLASILWQYEGAPMAVQLARNDQAWIDASQTKFWHDWRQDVFDLDTANEFGLSVWARILGVSIEVSERRRVDGVFGFGVSNRNFDNGNFGTARDGDTRLDKESARKLLKLRWFQLTMRPTVPNINKAIEDVFGPGAAFVVDSYDMSIVTFMFSAAPDYRLRRLLERTDILPRPSTVGVAWQVQTRPAWGFGPNHLNFENGSFGA
ncbi:DUF2612 domain-containing protein [Bordetella avium]|uniref:DUF2612 domain-containing protein n=1 Tax=Bordetella avium TaxID=521 RepID=UPI000E0C5E81|nr:DUF2612 domain-containing protein [Bordetella avium]UOK17090.1 hypothetical protein vBBaMIFTN2_24 [Bordetella phage vB_BaM-IFTN2]UOK17216.1 hypothetical protein vBBaMIFTN4_24 [Bordetella phage vB_BaM-IFTN4]UOK17288.1 hypothetical protein vBBaMIFTN5_24 [Bordetella phage vB_BaM-IFTN5]UOK17357.1 hypothetical protein vBBaMIFTN6_24 [Bordetella phage vB_BaM-IFTN6]UOK17421.1 hypothetical protein vBBaMIFTN7_24 [Bordetella phage vB_BaM-IFTN7]UOK17490.1 hypothetical protein vBBaMIFTN8_25 [Bordetella